MSDPVPPPHPELRRCHICGEAMGKPGKWFCSAGHSLVNDADFANKPGAEDVIFPELEKPALWLYDVTPLRAPWVVFPDGHSRRVTLKERVLWRLGKLERVKR